MQAPQALLYVDWTVNDITNFVIGLEVNAAVTNIERLAWGIDDSRQLREEAHRTSEAGRGRAFIIKTNAMNHEAQNALLKLFEEPPADVAFHCFFPPGLSLLPTLRSRLQLVDVVIRVESEDSFFKAFIGESLASQLKEIEARNKKKDVAWFLQMKSGVISFLASRKSALSPKTAGALLETALRIGSRGASNKMLLEHIVLMVSSGAKTR